MTTKIVAYNRDTFSPRKSSDISQTIQIGRIIAYSHIDGVIDVTAFDVPSIFVADIEVFAVAGIFLANGKRWRCDVAVAVVVVHIQLVGAEPL